MCQALTAAFFLFGTAVACLLVPGAAEGAQAPDPRDSIIIESKAVIPGSAPLPLNANPPYLAVRVFFTNKDTLAAIALPLLFTSTSGGAYAVLSYGPNNPFDGGAGPHREDDGTESVTMLLPPPQLSTVVFNFNFYHSNSPDTFKWAAVASPPTGARLVLPGPRRPFADLLFDSVFANPGTFTIDSGKVLSGTIGIVNRHGASSIPNFVKSVITVVCDSPPPIPSLTCPASPAAAQHGQPFTFDFNSSAQIPHFSLEQGPGSINPATGLYTVSNLCPPGPFPVKIRVVDSIAPGCKSEPVFCDFNLNVTNNAPFVTNCPQDVIQTQPDTSFSLQLTAVDADTADQNGLTFSLQFGPPGLSVTPTGLVQWTPSAEQTGPALACVLVSDPCGGGSLCCINFNQRKGDLNGDGILNPQDVVLMLNCAFLGIPPPAGVGACDVNCSGGASPLDVVYQMNVVFGYWSYPCP